ncbi:MAG: dTDP-glucose 4,6-dehydratase [Candidatus Ryanbacteria bacterium RIFCSPHIGHO2_12_FULL_47_12b]|uniref:dTDP-glucose 4,6-dehydratase n=2 Tax=Candidatus Ryaniibacteriota TaxID=1817914 RepID=A0A1G2H208_9BACT|nr:MAG: dTDP-glucose 4,6-dehydratase [Parcubacteria group bacterium GW2011_GWA2_47_10b]OGZ50080.1 MAG: dTDP-glucose 4,6-dehydratase [Candidatus Ryanbacteria bacterium RIFCSPHIGHO2_02_FULL_47_25]OGZ51759.1 MAG: dTDP-glucose 4,6-dehydratase [Candidatus Ryanbacteria bacterium RIFCSPLOWO2_01_FULL_47_79]OGZ52801.1 MAG: dTDP-glucose 4,6-dehydratase [Candidatus Ryanbacteria bacterium RIFCSPHIGHO2_12_FULL_47_12b]OGZ55205.1 MAG: dTDP-glucose 4,6-dehydratase [Candidatus Ryanbacteria bacterium RIFCSPLOWO2
MITKNRPYNILVTGGSGFIGSNFVRHVIQTQPQYQVVNLDLLTYAGNPQNLRDIERSPRYKFVHGDICNRPALDRLFKNNGFSTVVHFAAETHVDRSIINVSDFIRTNVEGTRTIIEAVRDFRTPRFIHISTDEIYGDVARGRSTERSPIRPSNPYSASKAAADVLVQSFIRTHKIPAIIVRGSNNYGPFQYPEKLIPLAITNLLASRKIPVHGAGTHVRSWLHVQDFCNAIELIMQRAPLFATYNVSGEEKTNLQILTMIAEHLGKNINEYKQHINDRPGADIRYAIASQKLKKELNWRPRYTLKSSMRNVINWYQTNKEWWQAIKRQKEFLGHYQKQSRGQWF